MNLLIISRRAFAFSPALCLGILPLRADTLLVTTTADSGPGSLRQAMLDSNSTAGPNTIDFDIPGFAPFVIFPTSPFPLVTTPVSIDGRSQPGFSGAPVIGIDGSFAGPANGLHIVSSNCLVQGLALTDFQVDTTLPDPSLTGNGILIESGGYHQILGNYLGVDTSGVGTTFGNLGAGLHLVDSHDNVIGGTATLDRNAIANNASSLGTFAHPGGGIIIYGALATNNLVRGNYIGLDAHGSALGNYNAGILLGADNNTIGGTGLGEGNVISATRGGAGYGIWLISHNCFPCEPVLNTIIEGNFIGTDPTGVVAMGNASTAIQIQLGLNNRIGAAAPGAGNLISGNGGDGISIGAFYASISANNVIQGNLIGTDKTGAAPLPNGNDGVAISWDTGADTSNNLLGATDNPSGANIIAFNGRNGVTVAGAPTGVSILANSIFGNGSLGIDLGGDGVTANHPCDTVSGPNNWQNYPVLNTAYTDGSHISLSGTLDSRANLPCTLEFFWSDGCDQNGHGEGKNFIGRLPVTPDGSCLGHFAATLTATVPANKFLTATATSSDKSTSEFAACAPILGAPSLSVTVAGVPPVVTVVWSAELIGWVLQRSPAGGLPSWTDDPTPMVVVGAQNTVTEPAVPGGDIYRLRSP